VIYETDDYGSSVNDALVSQAKSAGIEIVETKTIGVEAGSASAQIAAMKSAGVDAVALGTIAAPTSVILAEAQKQSLAAPIFNSIPGTLPAIVKQAIAADGSQIYATTPIACPIDPTFIGDCAKDFVADFEKEFDKEPGVYEAIGYVGALEFIAAVKRADSSSPEDIAKAMEDGTSTDNQLMPGVHWTADNHLGASVVYNQGITGGELSFFGRDINDNTLEK